MIYSCCTLSSFSLVWIVLLQLMFFFVLIIYSLLKWKLLYIKQNVFGHFISTFYGCNYFCHCQINVTIDVIALLIIMLYNAWMGICVQPGSYTLYFNNVPCAAGTSNFLLVLSLHHLNFLAILHLWLCTFFYITSIYALYFCSIHGDWKCKSSCDSCVMNIWVQHTEKKLCFC